MFQELCRIILLFTVFRANGRFFGRPYYWRDFRVLDLEALYLGGQMCFFEAGLFSELFG